MAIASVPSNRTILILATVLISLVNAPGQADEPVTVRLTDGSKLIAQVHPRTNDKHLWLRFGSGRAVILRSVAWDRIADATIGGQPVAAEALRAIAAQAIDESELAPPAAPRPVDESLTIRLTDGSKLIAEVHPRTNDEHLWLRFGSGRAVILRSVAWDRIADATIGDQPVTTEALREMAAQAIDETELAPPAPPQPAEEPSFAEQAHELLDFRRPIKSVDFDVRIANWDQDVEYDGLLLRLLPLDTDGQLTRARGTLSVDLVDIRRQKFDDVTSARGRLPSLLGQWTVQVNADEVTENGVVFKLPFQTNHPEFDTSWATHGLVHVRFVVPGQGVFDNSYDGVRVRPYAPLRDALELNNRSRFLPIEQTGVNKRSR